MDDQEREVALREVYSSISQQDRNRIMKLQVARRDSLAIRILKEFGTEEPDYTSAREYVRQNFEGSPIWEAHKRAGTGVTDVD